MRGSDWTPWLEQELREATAASAVQSAAALTRIADALDRIAPPPVPKPLVAFGVKSAQEHGLLARLRK